MKKTALREEFLKKFVETLIQEKAREQREKMQMEMVGVPQLVIPSREIQIKEIPIPQIIRKKTIIKHPLIAQKPMSPAKPVFAQPSQIPTIQLRAKPRELIALSNMEQILADPAVLSVECTGSGKPLLVNRSGAIQATSISLQSEEIDNIMKEISEITRIPLTTGMFRAVFGNFTAIAVVSEFAGTRFVIQKRYLQAPR